MSGSLSLLISLVIVAYIIISIVYFITIEHNLIAFVVIIWIVTIGGTLPEFYYFINRYANIYIYIYISLVIHPFLICCIVYLLSNLNLENIFTFKKIVSKENKDLLEYIILKSSLNNYEISLNKKDMFFNDYRILNYTFYYVFVMKENIKIFKFSKAGIKIKKTHRTLLKIEKNKENKEINKDLLNILDKKDYREFKLKKILKFL